MTKNKTEIRVDKELYTEFREFIKRTKGKVHGNLINSVEEALELYMQVHRDPVLRSHIYDQIQRGVGGTPLDHDSREEKFYKEFKNRFEDYHLVGSGELGTWIENFTGARNPSTIKKWRNRLRDKDLIVYKNNSLWIIPGNETTTQDTLPGAPEYILNVLEPGSLVSYKKLVSISGLEEDPLKELITRLEDTDRLEHTAPGKWLVLDP